MRMAARLAIYASVILGVTWLFQDRLLYYPGTETLDEVLRQAHSLGLSPWPEVSDYQALRSPDPGGEIHGTVVAFHGNAGLALHRIYYAEALVPRGYRVLLAEYPAYGARPGNLGEESFVADARRLLAEAQRQFGEPLYIYGESLGAGVAAAAVAETPVPVAGVAMITPWATLPDIAQDVFWFLPARLLVRDRYDNIENLNRWGGPVAVLIAAQDEVIPARHGQRLFDSLNTTKRRWVFEHGSHNDWPIEPEAAWWSEVLEFLRGAAATIP